MEALVGALNQEDALVEAFSVIVKLQYSRWYVWSSTQHSTAQCPGAADISRDEAVIGLLHTSHYSQHIFCSFILHTCLQLLCSLQTLVLCALKMPKNIICNTIIYFQCVFVFIYGVSYTRCLNVFLLQVGCKSMSLIQFRLSFYQLRDRVLHWPRSPCQ